MDCVIFGFDEAEGLQVLLFRRDEPPAEGEIALPGDLVEPDEDLESSASRILTLITGIDHLFLQQVRTFGQVDRHPQGRVLTIAYYALINVADYPITTTKEVEWYCIKKALEMDLPFDHHQILKASFSLLKNNVKTAPIGFELLPEKFTLSQLQLLYESILEKPLDKRNFRKKITGMGYLIPLDEKQTGVAHRPARLYKFNEAKYRKILEQGALGLEI